MCETKNILWHCTLEILLLLLLLKPLFPSQVIYLRLHNTKCGVFFFFLKKCVLLDSMEICVNRLCKKLFTFMLLIQVEGIRIFWKD